MDSKKTLFGRTCGVAVVAVLATLATSGIAAVADDIKNNLDATLDATAEVMALNVGTNGTTTLAVIPQGNGGPNPSDGKSGCNLTGGTTLGVAVNSSNPAVATASLSNSTFTSCGDRKIVTVHPLAVGSTTITLSQLSNDTGGTFDFAPATFTVNVSSPAPANTAPTVSVTGVTHAASYDKGSVPAATCSVTDAEDGPSSPAATLSTITGPNAADGIGSQTASCSYTDAGGLTATSSATYSIVDPSAPVITYTLNPTAPDGLAGWYTGTVTLVWNVSEPQSPGSLSRTGCADQTIAADQFATDYTCSASSAGGSSGPVSVSVKRDGHGPDVTYTSASGTAGDDGWFISPVTATFTATDGFSGPASQTGTNTSTVDGSAVTILSPAFSDDAGNTTVAGAASSPEFKIDTEAPEVGEAVLSGTVGDNGWYTSPVTAAFTATDETSGVAGDNPKTVSSGAQQGEELVLESPAFSDKAGNTTAAGAQKTTVKVDGLAPNAPTASLDPTPNGAGWNNSNVTVSFTSAGDNGASGVASCSAAVPVTVETESQTVSGTCTDLAGNVSDATNVTVKLDKTGPVVSDTVSVSGTEGKDGWYTSPVEVTFTATDPLSGPDSATQTVTSSGDGAAVEVASPAFSDVAGNTTDAGAVTKTYKIDTEAPEVGDAELSGTKGDNGWYRSDVTASFTATDETSGVAGDNPKTVTSSQQGTGIVLDSPAFSDAAGNTRPAGNKTATVKVDSIAPSVSLLEGPGDGSSYYFGSVPAAPTCAASDTAPGSGLAGACSVGGYDTSVGTHTVRAIATDYAGNSTTVTRTYTVRAWTMSGFYAPVDKGIHNTVKGGNTVPLKFELFAGPTELTDVAAVSFTTQKINCDGTLLQDGVEATSTVGTSLRYDTTGGQFIQNWKTPTGAGSCYKATMTADDGSAISALFKIK